MCWVPNTDTRKKIECNVPVGCSTVIDKKDRGFFTDCIFYRTVSEDLKKRM